MKLLARVCYCYWRGVVALTSDRPHKLIDRGEYKIDTNNPSVAQNERVRFGASYTATDDAESLHAY